MTTPASVRRQNAVCFFQARNVSIYTFLSHTATPRYCCLAKPHLKRKQNIDSDSNGSLYTTLNKIIGLLVYPQPLFCCCFFLVMRFTFRLAFRLEQLAVWGRPIPSSWVLVLQGLPTRFSFMAVDYLGGTWATFQLAFRLSAD